jgi:hypothetical protein
MYLSRETSKIVFTGADWFFGTVLLFPLGKRRTVIKYKSYPNKRRGTPVRVIEVDPDGTVINSYPDDGLLSEPDRKTTDLCTSPKNDLSVNPVDFNRDGNLQVETTKRLLPLALQVKKFYDALLILVYYLEEMTENRLVRKILNSLQYGLISYAKLSGVDFSTAQLMMINGLCKLNPHTSNYCR